MTLDIIGVGSPIIDLLAAVNDDFLKNIRGDKGGMVLVDDAEMDSILSLIDHRDIVIAPGGAAANTTFAATRLGLHSAFVGKLGNDDNAQFYQISYTKQGGDCSHFKFNPDKTSARCLSLITPDGQRTMRTNLAAASDLEPSDITDDDFAGASHVHIEGYLLFKPNLLETTLKKIKKAGCTVSLDLGSFEVVNDCIDILPGVLDNYVDIVIANEDEAFAFTGERDCAKSLAILSQHCPLAAVKMGKHGSLLSDRKQTIPIEPHTVSQVRDTTGAGDLWAAGFLYGYVKKMSLDKCGRIASLMGANAVECIGACTFDEERWEHIHDSVDSIQRA